MQPIAMQSVTKLCGSFHCPPFYDVTDTDCFDEMNKYNRKNTVSILFSLCSRSYTYRIVYLMSRATVLRQEIACRIVWRHRAIFLSVVVCDIYSGASREKVICKYGRRMVQFPRVMAYPRCCVYCKSILLLRRNAYGFILRRSPNGWRRWVLLSYEQRSWIQITRQTSSTADYKLGRIGL